MNRFLGYMKYGCAVILLFLVLHALPFVGYVLALDDGDMRQANIWFGLFCFSTVFMLVLVVIMTAYMNIGTSYDIKRKIQEKATV